MQRLWEVDSARGVAILMMVLSNFLLDLYLFAGCAGCYSGFWFYFARATAVLFVLLVGVSLTLSFSRLKKGDPRKYLKRGVRIFLYGVAITLATWLFFREGTVIFGVLHLIGVSIILAYPLLNRKWLALGLGVIVTVMGFLIENISISNSWLLWLGIKSPGFFSVDYTPLFPWFGVVLIGVFLGNFLFPGGKAIFKENNSIPVKFLAKLGRHSLFIYLVHQPALIIIMMLVLGPFSIPV